jgi:hypothetical protein
MPDRQEPLPGVESARLTHNERKASSIAEAVELSVQLFSKSIDGLR